MTTSNEHNNAPAVQQGEPVAWQARCVWPNGRKSTKWSLVTATNAKLTPKMRAEYLARLTHPDGSPSYEVRALYAATAAPASTGMHWTENEPVRLPHARAGRVYLAGPMTGISELNFPAFNQEAERLRAEGLQVLNPADHGIVDGADWADYLRHDIAGLASCERIHLLRGWTKSKGACLEMTIAKALGMTVTYQVDAEMEHSNAPAVPQGWRDFLTELSKQKPEKPDYWSSCGQCERNSSTAEDLLAATPDPVPAQGEPFGHFRVEPFGWTDCAKDDEGAIALYERPQEVGLTDEERADMACAVAAICTGTSSRTVAATAIEWTERALRAKGGKHV